MKDSRASLADAHLVEHAPASNTAWWGGSFEIGLLYGCHLAAVATLCLTGRVPTMLLLVGMVCQEPCLVSLLCVCFAVESPHIIM